MVTALKTKEELFQLTSSQSGITKANGIAAIWSENYKYKVPIGWTFIFKPGHTFSASLNNGTSSPAASGTKLAGDYVDTDKVRITVRNADQTERKTILQETIYKRVQESADRDKMCRLDVNEPVAVSAGGWVVIETYATTALANTDADSWFILYCDRVRQGII